MNDPMRGMLIALMMSLPVWALIIWLVIHNMGG